MAKKCKRMGAKLRPVCNRPGGKGKKKRCYPSPTTGKKVRRVAVCREY